MFFRGHRSFLKTKKQLCFLEQCFPQLTQPNSIMIPLTFPCLKFCRGVPTSSSLISNIESYNHQLRQLSFRGTFTIIDCRIQDRHLAHDRIHLFVDVYRRLFDFIIDYLNSPKRTNELEKNIFLFFHEIQFSR